MTVMFSDLVGSTPFSARRDPEDLRESSYQCASGAGWKEGDKEHHLALLVSYLQH